MESPEKASASYAAMQSNLYIADGRGLYKETSAADSPAAYLWPASRAYLATLCMAGMPGQSTAFRKAVQECASGLERYWATPAYSSAIVPPGGDLFYDDNAWVALSLILQYRLGLTTDLHRPEQLFEFARRGWDPRLGGVYWVQQGRGYGLSNHDRGAGATAGSAEVGLHLHELAGSSLDDAVRMVDWVAAHLDQSGTGSGPFQNVVRRDGSIDTNIWSYNQGVMLGARTLQHRLKPNSTFLAAAEGIARQTLATFGDFTNHPPSFNAMCFQNMLMLHAVTSDATLKTNMRSAMQRYADWAWTSARDANNLFYFDDGGRPRLGQPGVSARVQDQGAMTQIYALLAWDSADYGKLT